MKAKANITDYRSFLAHHFAERQKKSPLYSLRSYARFLGISPAQLSKILNQKQALSPKHALKIADKFALSPRQKEQLLNSLNSKHIEGARVATSYQPVAEDRFRLISDWWHFAILSLGEVEKNRAEPKWIAKRLGITERNAKEAWDRLTRLGLLEVKNGSYRQIGNPLSTTTDIPSSAIRKYHQQNLELAAQRLQEVPVEKREFTSVTVAIDPEHLPEAKTILRNCKRQLADLFKTEGQKSAVYTLAMQLFPVSKE